MKLREFVNADDKILKLVESASGGSSSAGGIASVANPMMGTISRTPNLFGWVPPASKKKKKKAEK